MNDSWPKRHPRESVSRRSALRMAGGAGLAAFVSACAGRIRSGGVTESTSSGNPSLAATTGAEPSTLPVATDDSTAPSAPVSTTPSGVMLCREAWGARPARAGGIRQVPDRITIHHSAVILGDNRNAPSRIRADQRYHQDTQGWTDIAYHVGVDLNGNIYELRDPELVGDTATTYDPSGHFLILCEGNFDEEEVTEELLTGIAQTGAWAAKRYLISPDRIAGHKDFAATSYPGANLYAHIVSGEIRRRLDDLVATPGSDLQRICGPAADAKVAAIEAGN